VKKYGWLVYVREKYYFGWKFTIVYDKPQPNEQTDSVFSFITKYHQLAYKPQKRSSEQGDEPIYQWPSILSVHSAAGGTEAVRLSYEPYIFSEEIMFFSHNKSTNNIFRPGLCEHGHL